MQRGMQYPRRFAADLSDSAGLYDCVGDPDRQGVVAKTEQGLALSRGARELNLVLLRLVQPDDVGRRCRNDRKMQSQQLPANYRDRASDAVIAGIAEFEFVSALQT